MLFAMFQKLLEKFKKPKICLIATQSRSGTWYSRYFFFGLDKLLRGENPDTLQLANAFEKQKERFFVKETLNIDRLLVGHATCPGFKERYRGNLREAWDKLQFFGGGAAHDHLDSVLNLPSYKSLFDPYYNKNARIVYFHRNPLDQAVSSFPRLLHNNLIKISYKNEREFLHDASIEAFIKQFITFSEMKKIFPEHILMISYEDLVRSPQTSFDKVLDHFGYSVKNNKSEKIVERAIQLASIENLRGVEQKMGRALGNDQVGRWESHFRGGGTIGKWKNYFNEEDKKMVETRLAAFNLSLKNLILE